MPAKFQGDTSIWTHDLAPLTLDFARSYDKTSLVILNQSLGLQALDIHVYDLTVCLSFDLVDSEEFHQYHFTATSYGVAARILHENCVSNMVADALNPAG